MYDRWPYEVRRWVAIKLAEKNKEINRLNARLAVLEELQLAEIRRMGT